MGQPPDPAEKIFSVEEANALLPAITPLIEQLQGLERSIRQTAEQIDELTEKLSHGNGYPTEALNEQLDQLKEHQERLVGAFQSTHDRLGELGCQLKDLRIGLVDFFGLRDGQRIYLCWKLGEKRVAHWHTLEAGYAGRQPLD
jgi:hypothetical protein